MRTGKSRRVLTASGRRQITTSGEERKLSHERCEIPYFSYFSIEWGCWFVKFWRSVLTGMVETRKACWNPVNAWQVLSVRFLSFLAHFLSGIVPVRYQCRLSLFCFGNCPHINRFGAYLFYFFSGPFRTHIRFVGDYAGTDFQLFP